MPVPGTRGREVARALLAGKASALIWSLSKGHFSLLKMFISVVIISVRVCVRACVCMRVYKCSCVYVVYVHVTMSCVCLGNGDKMKSP